MAFPRIGFVGQSANSTGAVSHELKNRWVIDKQRNVEIAVRVEPVTQRISRVDGARAPLADDHASDTFCA